MEVVLDLVHLGVDCIHLGVDCIHLGVDCIQLTIEVVRNTYWDEDTGEWSYMAEFSFGPDGLVFDPRRQPRLIIDASWLDLGNDEAAVLRYCNEDTGLWKVIAHDVVSRGIMEFYVGHFSLYAIS